MNLSQVESEFIKIKKCIKSVTHAGQIPSCENLISLFQKKHFEDEITWMKCRWNLKLKHLKN